MQAHTKRVVSKRRVAGPADAKSSRSHCRAAISPVPQAVGLGGRKPGQGLCLGEAWARFEAVGWDEV